MKLENIKIEQPEAFDKCIVETQRLFSMNRNRTSYDPEGTARRWQELIKLANVLIELTDRPLRTPIQQMFNNCCNQTDSVFLQSFARANFIS